MAFFRTKLRIPSMCHVLVIIPEPLHVWKQRGRLTQMRSTPVDTPSGSITAGQTKLNPSNTRMLSSLFLEQQYQQQQQSYIPDFVKENGTLVLFFSILSYALFVLHWIVSTDWETKFHYASLILAATGILYLHYSQAVLVQQFEILFVSMWTILGFYHVSTWKNNYSKVTNELASMASLRPYQGSLLRFFITLPRHKTSSNQWESPPFSNAIHILLMGSYGLLLLLHLVPFVSPSCPNNNALCCRYNYVMEGSFDTQSVSSNFCGGPVRIAFAGSWSTGKTTIINALLGHDYSMSQIAPAPTTDKFICLTMGAPYSGPIQSDDYERRINCEMMGHVQDITQNKVCNGAGLANTVDVADTNTEFTGFVFLDMPGWQNEYYHDCAYRTFYQQLMDQIDFVYVVWDVNHGKVEEEFASFFQGKARGTNYEVIYNRYNGNENADMAFLNQQYAKLSNGAQELLSELYTIKIHDHTISRDSFQQDVVHLRAKIQSVNQTVHDNRKLLMKENLIKVRAGQMQMTGLLSLRKLKITDRLIQQELNIHKEPKKVSWWLRSIGIEL